MKQQIKHILFHRHLIYEFLKRDLQARYLGSAIGFFWSVVNPLILLAVYTIVFGYILRAKYEALGFGEAGTVAFAFYIFSGLMPWFAFQESLMRSTTCIVDNAHLIKQVRFPAKVLPAYLAISSLVNQMIGTFIFMAGYMLMTGSAHWTWLLLPLVIAIEFVMFFGLGLFFSTLHTYVRDVGPLISIVTMILMWTTPMLYTMEMAQKAPQWVQSILYLNPITYLILLHHDMMLDGVWPALYLWLVFGALSLISLAAGYVLFTRCHSEFSDLL
ncbi:ABC transporter permease [bacterium]|nr:ABC transporter permease [bacterium]